MAMSSRRCFLKAFKSYSRLKNALSGRPTSWCQVSTAKSAPNINILYSAVCLERLPVISPPKTKLENEFSDMMSQIELENSLLSDHELRLRHEKLASEKLKEMEEDEDNVKAESGDLETQTALDLEDKWDAEFKAFSTADRITAADKKSDHRSVGRKLDSSLYLLVKQKIEGRDHWVMPQATWKQGESMRQTAERALASVCGEIKATFLGNAPCSVAKYEPAHDEDERGIKLFFFKAWYSEGQVTPNRDFASDYVWVTKEELSQYCNVAYKRNFKKCIVDA